MNHPAEVFPYGQNACYDTVFHVQCARLLDQPFFGEIAITPTRYDSFARIYSRDHQVVKGARRIQQTNERVVHIYVQDSGTGLFVQNGRKTEVSAGDFICLDSVQPSSWSSKEDCRILVLLVPRDLLVKRLGPVEQFTACVVRGNTPIGSLVSSFLRSAASVARVADPVTARRISEIALDLVTAALGELISHQPQQKPSWGRIALLYRAKSFAEENLHDPALNSAMIAHALKISVRYLQELFHDESTTVSNWICHARLERCRRELADPLLANKGVSQIAYDCGFSDLSHFGHRFKEAFSVSPSGFRHGQP